MCNSFACIIVIPNLALFFCYFMCFRKEKLCNIRGYFLQAPKQCIFAFSNFIFIRYFHFPFDIAHCNIPVNYVGDDSACLGIVFKLTT